MTTTSGRDRNRGSVSVRNDGTTGVELAKDQNHLLGKETSNLIYGIKIFSFITVNMVQCPWKGATSLRTTRREGVMKTTLSKTGFRYSVNPSRVQHRVLSSKILIPGVYPTLIPSTTHLVQLEGNFLRVSESR